MDPLYEYFIRPILEHSGYNPVNTTVYALLALGFVYLIFKFLRREGIRIDRSFMVRILPFVLLGSTIRVVTDSVDTGRMLEMGGVYDLILSSHVYDYGFLTVSPGIYVIIGGLALGLTYLSYKWGKKDLGMEIALILWAFHMAILIPMGVHWLYAGVVLALTALITLAYLRLKGKSNIPLHWMIVLGQTLDGAATFITLDVFNTVEAGSYVEQHVVANALSSLFGGSMLPYFILKILVAILAVYLLEREKDPDERNYIALLVMIIGLAPGIRDLLRLWVGA